MKGAIEATASAGAGWAIITMATKASRCVLVGMTALQQSTLEGLVRGNIWQPPR
jgi:hypothetical protein